MQPTFTTFVTLLSSHKAWLSLRRDLERIVMKRMNTTGIRINPPGSQTIHLSLWVCFFLILIFISLEMLTNTGWVKTLLPYPSPTFSSTYPELDVKFQRLHPSTAYNCMFFGSSMMDAALNAEIFEDRILEAYGEDISCFNMAFSGSMVESTHAAVAAFSNSYPLEFVVIGISPIEMDKNFTLTRSFSKIPIITYMKGNPTIAGWFYGRTRLPWYLTALFHKGNLDYQAEVEYFDEILDEHGGRVTSKVIEFDQSTLLTMLHDFHINPVDMENLDLMITSLKNQGIQVIMVEMPVHPRFFPFLIEGGPKIYEKEFLIPTREYLHTKGIPFIETQTDIESLVTDQEWANRSHFNVNGRDLFTELIIERIVNEGMIN